MYMILSGYWGNMVYINLCFSQFVVFLTPLLHQTITNLNHELPLENIHTLNQIMHDTTTNEHTIAKLVDFFITTALDLVTVNLYNTLNYHIVQHTRKINVHLTIDALENNILHLVFEQNLR
jgi:hypothetical protein